jgi:acyl-[acyl carrier protein]--UDP-N-acetylglucosamine O-acyltransferase
MKIHETAVIYPNVTIEEGVEIGPFCIIGAKAEHKAHWNEDLNFGVVIRKGAIITGHVTIDAGTHRPTEIGEGAFIMKGVYIGHDALIGQGATLSPHVVISGHCEIGYLTNMGISSVVHQFVKVPALCMIGMNATVTKKTQLIENGVYIGSPAKWIRENRK